MNNDPALPDEIEPDEIEMDSGFSDKCRKLLDRLVKGL